MLDYVLVGSDRLEAAWAFYDRWMSGLGLHRVRAVENKLVLWGAGGDAPRFGVIRPYDGGPATGGNGTMVAFRAPSRAAVRALHADALRLGGTNEGDPGVRGPDPNGFYGGYFRDLDGNKICVFFRGPEAEGRDHVA